MSRTRILALALCLVVALAGISLTYAHGRDSNFHAVLSGRNEIPANDSAGRGISLLHLDREGDTLFYWLRVRHLAGITQAHIHCGSEDVNGPVVAFLFGPVPAGSDENGTIARGSVTAADVIPRPDSPECPGGVADFEDLVAKLRSGDAYVNVHTLTFPGGEIRGQVR
jgi:hypothetical protein